jgi:hypothetical protein
MRLTSKTGIVIWKWRIIVEYGVSKSRKTYYLRLGFGKATKQSKARNENRPLETRQSL